MSEQQAELLADRVSAAVIKSGVQQEILDSLLNAVKGNVREQVLKALLIYAGGKISERDRDWVRQFSGVVPKLGSRGATNPSEVMEAIMEFVADREKDIRLEERRKGFEAGFRDGVSKSVKFGWGACEAGKGLDEALKASESLKPSLSL